MWRIRSKERNAWCLLGLLLGEVERTGIRRVGDVEEKDFMSCTEPPATLKAVTKQLPVGARQTQTGRSPFRFPIAARGQRGHLLRREWTREKVRGDGEDLNMSHL